MLLSIIVPARNAEVHLGQCLSRLNEFVSQSFECIVVDDASEDGTSDVARRYGAQILRNERRLGPGACRNMGARAAKGSVLLFLDADTLLHAGALELISSRFEAQPELAAVFGSYDASPKEKSAVSRYRNLLHCYTHQNGSSLSRTFWSGCGAIRKEVFLAAGGFAPSYDGPEIEDVELGYRLHAAGCRVELDPRLQVTHLKLWTLRKVLYADIRYRGIPWTVLALRTGALPDDLATRTSQRFSVLFTLLMVCSLAVFLFTARPEALWLAAAGAVGTGGTNLAFFRFLGRTHGWRLTLTAPPLQVLYNCCCLVSLVCGTLVFARSLYRVTLPEYNSLFRPD